MRTGSSVSAFRECGHQPPSAAPCRLRVGSKATRGDGGPAMIALPGAACCPDPLADGGRVLLVLWCGTAGPRIRFLLSRIGVGRCGAAHSRLAAGGAISGANPHRAGQASARPLRPTPLRRSLPGWLAATRCAPGGSRRVRGCHRPVARSPQAARCRQAGPGQACRRPPKSRAKACMASSLLSGRGAQLPPDTRHRKRGEHGGDDGQANEDHRLLPPVTGVLAAVDD